MNPTYALVATRDIYVGDTVQEPDFEIRAFDYKGNDPRVIAYYSLERVQGYLRRIIGQWAAEDFEAGGFVDETEFEPHR